MEDFTSAMRTRTDEQLIAAVTVDRAHYHQAAVDAAKAELERRGIDKDLYQRTEAALLEERSVSEARAAAPLPIIFKVLGFLFPGVIVLFAILFLKKDGYDRRYQELGRWSLYGVLFYIVLFTLTAR